MIIFYLKITPPPSKRRDLLEILHGVAGPTSIQPGCQACEIYEGSREEQAVFFLEQWDSLAAIRRHIQSHAFLKILTAIELSTTQPVISFHETSQTWGMELIESSRNPEGLHE